MKKALLFLITFAWILPSAVAQVDLSYYLPDSVTTIPLFQRQNQLSGMRWANGMSHTTGSSSICMRWIRHPTGLRSK
jgi:hypothetical protein